MRFERCRGYIYPYRRWLGEKYDGIRSCWNSITKQLYPYSPFFFSSSSFFTSISLLTSAFASLSLICRYSRASQTLELPTPLYQQLQQVPLECFLDAEIWYSFLMPPLFTHLSNSCTRSLVNIYSRLHIITRNVACMLKGHTHTITLGLAGGHFQMRRR